MTTAAPERPPTRPPTELENRRIKARAIALYLWRLGLTVEDVRALPYSSRTDRSIPTMTKLARAAFAASPRPEAREKDPPDGRSSRTWAIAEEKLAEIASMAARGLPVPERDLLQERDLWLPHQPTPAQTDAPPALPPAPRAPTDVAPSGTLVLDVAPFDASGDPFAVLGPPCPDCGWRRGLHRPAVLGWLDACPSGGAR